MLDPTIIMPNGWFYSSGIPDIIAWILTKIPIFV